jgi:membrane protease YdiL (CAAX protease family)
MDEVTESRPAPRPAWPTWIEILLCSGYPSQILIGVALQAAGLRPLRDDGALSATFVFALSLADTVVLLSLILVFLSRRGERPAEVFFGGRPAGGEIAVGVVSVPLVITTVVALTLLIRHFAPFLRTVPDNPLQGLLGTQAGLLMFLFVVIVAGGIREELQRAFLLHRFRTDFGRPWAGLVVTSVAFGLGHTLQGLDATVITGALGALWGALYLARGSALGPMVSHSLFNSSELVRVFLR